MTRPSSSQTSRDLWLEMESRIGSTTRPTPTLIWLSGTHSTRLSFTISSSLSSVTSMVPISRTRPMPAWTCLTSSTDLWLMLMFTTSSVFAMALSHTLLSRVPKKKSIDTWPTIVKTTTPHGSNAHSSKDPASSWESCHPAPGALLCKSTWTSGKSDQTWTSQLTSKHGNSAPLTFITWSRRRVHNGSTRNSRANTECSSTQETSMVQSQQLARKNGSQPWDGRPLRTGDHTSLTTRWPATSRLTMAIWLSQPFTELDTWRHSSSVSKHTTWSSTGFTRNKSEVNLESINICSNHSNIQT